MTDLVPRLPQRPLIWPDFVSDLQDFAASIPDPIYVVGGAVRDAMLHRPIHDIDLVTPVAAVTTARRIANHFKGDVYVLDAERDVGRAIVNTPDGRISIDVARYRGPGLLEDLVDRDFTVNAMAVDLKGDLHLVIDPLGGETDLSTRRIRRCSPASLPQDPVRSWRAVRQSSQFGFRIDAETLRDVRAAVPFTLEVSPERLRDEFIRVLGLPRPSAALRVLHSVGLLGAFIPAVENLRPDVTWDQTLIRVEHLTAIMNVIGYSRTDNTVASFSYGMIAIQLDRYRRSLIHHLDTQWPNERPHRALLMLAALLVSAQPDMVVNVWAETIGTALRFSNAERTRLALLVQYARSPLQMVDCDARSIHRFWRQMGEAGVDVCLLALADYLCRAGQALDQNLWLILVDRIRLILEGYFEKAEQLVHPPPLIDGTVLMRELGLKGGPLIGELLEYLVEEQAVGGVRDAESALAAARDYLAHRIENLH